MTELTLIRCCLSMLNQLFVRLPRCSYSPIHFPPWFRCHSLLCCQYCWDGFLHRTWFSLQFTQFRLDRLLLIFGYCLFAGFADLQDSLKAALECPVVRITPETRIQSIHLWVLVTNWLNPLTLTAVWTCLIRIGSWEDKGWLVSKYWFAKSRSSSWTIVSFVCWGTVANIECFVVLPIKGFLQIEIASSFTTGPREYLDFFHWEKVKFGIYSRPFWNACDNPWLWHSDLRRVIISTKSTMNSDFTSDETLWWKNALCRDGRVVRLVASVKIQCTWETRHTLQGICGTTLNVSEFIVRYSKTPVARLIVRWSAFTIGIGLFFTSDVGVR